MNENKNPLISVVVPIYKVEAYLNRCLDSILKQSYSNLEIVLIDDGSPDGCPKICDDYALRDSRIKVVHKENGGLADARNAGVIKSTGEYISFVDSDDFVTPDYIENLYRGISEFNADISLATFQSFEREDDICFDKRECRFSLLSKESVFERYTSLQTSISMPFISACNKLYKRALFEGIYYPKGKLYEDSFTSYKLLDSATKIVMTETPLYFYFINPASIMGQKFKEKHLEVLEAFKGAITFFESKGDISVSKMFYAPLVMREIYCWWGCRYVLNDRSKSTEILKQLRQDCAVLKSCSNLSKTWKLALIFFVKFPTLYAIYRMLSPVYVGGRQ